MYLLACVNMFSWQWTCEHIDKYEYVHVYVWLCELMCAFMCINTFLWLFLYACTWSSILLIYMCMYGHFLCVLIYEFRSCLCVCQCVSFSESFHVFVCLCEWIHECVDVSEYCVMVIWLMCKCCWVCNCMLVFGSLIFFLLRPAYLHCPFARLKYYRGCENSKLLDATEKHNLLFSHQFTAKCITSHCC